MMAKITSGPIKTVAIDTNPDSFFLEGPAMQVIVVTATTETKMKAGRPMKGFPVDQTYVDDHGLIDGVEHRVFIVPVADYGTIEGASIPMFGLVLSDAYVLDDYIVDQNDYVLPTP